MECSYDINADTLEIRFGTGTVARVFDEYLQAGIEVGYTTDDKILSVKLHRVSDCVLDPMNVRFEHKRIPLDQEPEPAPKPVSCMGSFATLFRGPTDRGNRQPALRDMLDCVEVTTWELPDGYIRLLDIHFREKDYGVYDEGNEGLVVDLHPTTVKPCSLKLFSPANLVANPYSLLRMDP